MKLLDRLSPNTFAKGAIGTVVAMVLVFVGLVLYSLSSGLPTLEQHEIKLNNPIPHPIESPCAHEPL